MENKINQQGPSQKVINQKLNNTDEKYSSPIVDMQKSLQKGPRRFVGSSHKAGWMNSLKKHQEDYKAQIGEVFGDKKKLSLSKLDQHHENKRKINLQKFYKQMLDKQVELKKSREVEKRAKEIREDIFTASLGNSMTKGLDIDSKFQKFGNPMEYDGICAYNNKTIDCLPHEWNEPGMRYLRKSMSSTNKGAKFMKDPQVSGSYLKRSVDNSLTRYNDAPVGYRKQTLDKNQGKRSMLEPLLNCDTRRKIRKQMVQSYKIELDKQRARKQVKPQDLLDTYEYDETMAVAEQRSQAYPINQNGAFVRDSEYDKQITKFIERDMAIDNYYKKEMFDEDVFKRRDLRSKIKKLTSNYANQQRNLSGMRNSNSQKHRLGNASRTPQVQNELTHKNPYQNPGDLKTREKGFHKQNSKEAYDIKEGANHMRSNMGSRDERLKVPKSISQKAPHHPPSSISYPINEPVPATVGRYMENEGSKRKRLLQASNQINTGNPFAKLQLPAQEAYIAKHLGMFKPY
ncbi:unnamed protein product [Moneuplotes crassus]|uniref:Uncharacterized protein n=1 Tax=Euplotes crassus TaxID=5936 RepID=A0AAD1X3T5_EUPCR|nr:unnamed protein product [Moneuplotes crassus]